MSTQFYTPGQQTTDEQTPYQGTPRHQTPRHQGGRPSWFRISAVVIAAAMVAAIVGLAVALSHSHSSQAPATTGPSSSTSAPASPTTPANPVTPSHPVTPVPPTTPVMQLQRQLGQLNYYEGSVDGLMGPQTIAAIKDLQRQAGLPQTGQMNAATQAALANYLAHGNNQMGGNS